MSRRRDMELHLALADNPAHTLLLVSLEVAVPLWIGKLHNLDGIARLDQTSRWATAAVDVIGSRGDVLQFGAKRDGQAADAFNHMARGLAALAMSPGGVLFAGRHWCVEHRWGVACRHPWDLTCSADGLDLAPVAAAEAV